MTAAVALPLWGTDGDADFPPGSALDRFFAKVEIGDCWLWTGATDRGYGKFYPHGKTVRAHRWLYEQLVGPVPAGLTLDHLCRVRACVNPDHLEVVTQGVNLARSPLLPNGRKTHCKRGHPLDGTNLTTEPDGRRTCITCRRLRDAQRRDRESQGGGRVRGRRGSVQRLGRLPGAAGPAEIGEQRHRASRQTGPGGPQT